MPYRDRLKELDLFCVSKRRSKDDLIMVISTSKGGEILDANGIFGLAVNGTTRLNVWKLKPNKFKLEIWHTF